MQTDTAHNMETNESHCIETLTILMLHSSQTADAYSSHPENAQNRKGIYILNIADWLQYCSSAVQLTTYGLKTHLTAYI